MLYRIVYDRQNDFTFLSSLFGFVGFTVVVVKIHHHHVIRTDCEGRVSL